MTSSGRSVGSPPKRARKSASGAAVKNKPAVGKRARKSATTVAITTELAPAVAIALLDKTEHEPGAPAPALECLGAAATPSETQGQVRVQLLFENGAVLPVEMSEAAGAALSKGLAAELTKR